jgi:hypothetical protein
LLKARILPGKETVLHQWTAFRRLADSRATDAGQVFFQRLSRSSPFPWTSCFGVLCAVIQSHNRKETHTENPQTMSPEGTNLGDFENPKI